MKQYVQYVKSCYLALPENLVNKEWFEEDRVKKPWELPGKAIILLSEFPVWGVYGLDAKRGNADLRQWHSLTAITICILPFSTVISG